MSLREIIDFVKSNRWLLNIAAVVYNIIHLSYPLRQVLSGRLQCSGVFFKNVSFQIKGKNIKIEIGELTRLSDCCITIKGSECCAIIKGGGRLSNVHLYIQDDKSAIKIGRKFTIESGHIASTEGELIDIGDDCMFSNDIEIRNGDSHAIVDMESLTRTNNARSVKIGNHVWLTAHCRVLKGSVIPDDCIIGNSAIVSGQLKTSHAIYGGSPLRLLQENRTWDRDRYKTTFEINKQ